MRIYAKNGDPPKQEVESSNPNSHNRLVANLNTTQKKAIKCISRTQGGRR